MTLSRLLNIALILLGGFIALYAQADVKQNQYLLIIGIVALMLGLYRVSRNISSKNDANDESINDDENDSA